MQCHCSSSSAVSTTCLRLARTTRTKEAQSIDFKNSYSPENRTEMAKDMAAFANALGGVILVGTSKDDEPLAYPGVSRDFAERLSDGFADAHARHLSPKPPMIERLILRYPIATRSSLRSTYTHFPIRLLELELLPAAGDFLSA